MRLWSHLSPLFDEMYSAIGRPSIPPERLLKGSLLMALYTVRSERMLCEQLDYNLFFRGSSIWMRPSRASTIRPSRATGRGFWSTTWRANFLPAWSRRPGPCSCFRTSLRRGWHADPDLGGAHRDSSARSGNRASRPTTPATRRLTSTASAAATRLISRPPTPRRSWRRRARARKRSCVTRPTR